MNTTLAYVIGYGIPFGISLLTSVGAVICVGLALAYPRFVALGYVAILMLFPGATSYGSLVEDTSNIYSRGTGTFFFSFLNLTIFGTWLLAVVYSRWWQRERGPWLPLAKYYLAFLALFVGHVIADTFDPKHFTLLDFYGNGVINLFWQGMFVSLLVATMRTERDLRTLVWLLLTCLAGREAFGLVRYAFFGGDPQNAYANLENLNVKITFWDINDSILAALAMGFCAWKLFAERVQGWQRLAYSAFGVMALLVPLLSSRRTAQAGLLLAMAALYLLLPRGRRWPIVLAIVAAVPAVGALTLQRSSAQGSLVQRMLLDVKISDVADPRNTRFYELETAWQTIQKDPVFGVGPAGEFRVTSSRGLEYHRGRYDFVHSGLGHVLLKTGFVGLLIFGGLLVAYLRFLRRHWPAVPGEWRALAVAAVCGFAAQLPNLLFGTPVVEIRTMQILGFILAVPFMLHGLRAAEEANSRPMKPVNAALAPGYR